MIAPMAFSVSRTVDIVDRDKGDHFSAEKGHSDQTRHLPRNAAFHKILTSSTTTLNGSVNKIHPLTDTTFDFSVRFSQSDDIFWFQNCPRGREGILGQKCFRLSCLEI